MGGCRKVLVSSIKRVLQSRSLTSQSDHFHLRQRPDGPTDSLRRKVAEMNKKRLRKKAGEAVLVAVPESQKYLDTPTVPMTLTFVGIAIAAKILWEYEYSDEKMQERIEQQIKDAPEGQGSIRMLTREEWEEIREIRPRTPFESKFARANARIRTGEPVSREDVKDWTIDVITDALTRVEETVRNGSS